ncbi:MAG: alpha/beta hydrolase [Pseudomonadota bacterium]|nr:alpha/beta hydrolase [Pseudomonadota bacterium]
MIESPRTAREALYTLRGLTFAALEWGPPVSPAAGGAPPTLLLHGFLDHAGSWARVAEQLDGPVVALDLRGHGRSAWVGPGESYHFPEYLADVDALVAALGGRVRLVGHSMGGSIASMYAGARPEAVERLAIVDGMGIPDGGAAARDRMVQFLDGIARVRAPRPYPTLAAAAARLVSTWSGLDPAWALELAERGTRPVDEGFVWRYDPRHLVRAAVPYRQDQHLRFLAAIRCPVLSVHPEHSLFAVADVAALEAAIPDLVVKEVLGAGHMTQLDAPRALAAHLTAFLR